MKDFIIKAVDPYLALMHRAKPLANGYSPAELGRMLCTTVPVILSMLNPGWMDMDRLKAEEMVKSEKQGKQYNKRHRAHDLPQLHPGEPELISDTKEKWTVITKAETPRSDLVDSTKGILVN